MWLNLRSTRNSDAARKWITLAKTVALSATLLVALGLTAQEITPYNQKNDVVYGEVHGTGLLMDVFTPKEKPNGLGIIDVVSGAYHSDRGKIRDHTLAQFYTIFCSR